MKMDFELLKNIFNEGNEFALKFLKDPLKFCESHNFTVYNNHNMESYVLIHEINKNSFAFMDLYDGGFTSMVVDKNALNNLIKSHDKDYNLSLLVDNEIFLIWLKDNLEIFENEYNKRKDY
jgi:hypothetical protein